MSAQTSSPARFLAPLALVLVAVVFFAIVLGSGSSDDGTAARSGDTDTATEASGGERPKAKRTPATYTVKTGDTLGGIAESTGVTVETLQELNPELDPQALVSGQKIKLRQ